MCWYSHPRRVPDLVRGSEKRFLFLRCQACSASSRPSTGKKGPILSRYPPHSPPNGTVANGYLGIAGQATPTRAAAASPSAYGIQDERLGLDNQRDRRSWPLRLPEPRGLHGGGPRLSPAAPPRERLVSREPVVLVPEQRVPRLAAAAAAPAARPAAGAVPSAAADAGLPTSTAQLDPAGMLRRRVRRLVARQVADHKQEACPCRRACRGGHVHLDHGGARARPSAVWARRGAAASGCGAAGGDGMDRGDSSGGQVPRGVELGWMLVPPGSGKRSVGHNWPKHARPPGRSAVVGRPTARGVEAADIVGALGTRPTARHRGGQSGLHEPAAGGRRGRALGRRAEAPRDTAVVRARADKPDLHEAEPTAADRVRARADEDGLGTRQALPVRPNSAADQLRGHSVHRLHHAQGRVCLSDCMKRKSDYLHISDTRAGTKTLAPPMQNTLYTGRHTSECGRRTTEPAIAPRLTERAPQSVSPRRRNPKHPELRVACRYSPGPLGRRLDVTSLGPRTTKRTTSPKTSVSDAPKMEESSPLRGCGGLPGPQARKRPYLMRQKWRRARLSADAAACQDHTTCSPAAAQPNLPPHSLRRMSLRFSSYSGCDTSPSVSSVRSASSRSLASSGASPSPSSPSS